MTNTRFLVAAAILEPRLASYVILALDRHEQFPDDIMNVALTVAALHHRGERGGLEQVVALLDSWGEREEISTARQLAVATPEVLVVVEELMTELDALPSIYKEPIVIAANAILG